MSKGTRSQADKDQVEDLYKTALETQDTRRNKRNTLYTSTPAGPLGSTSRPNNFSLENPEINLTDTALITQPLVLDSDDSADTDSTEFKDISGIKIDSYNYSEESANMANANPFATLKYAVEAVPFFDGSNIPLNYFIEGCEEAKSMLPKEAEAQFTKILRTRIVGEARRTIRDQDFDKVSNLTSYLKQIYGPTKNVYQLQGELGCIYQRNEEDVVTYANRVKFLGKQILEAYKNSGHILPEQNIKTTVEKDMCKCFIRGLKPEIEQRIARDLDVQETVADALRIERELREMTGLRQGLNIYSSQPLLAPTNKARETCQICFKEGHIANNCRKLTQFSLQGHDFQTNLGTEILICQICKKRGHSADKCRQRDPRARQPINVIQEKNISCQLCSKVGHDAKSCQQNNSKQRANKPTIICQWCDRPGHSANNCWKKQNEERNSENTPKVTCQLCDKFGHAAKDCRVKINQQTTPKNNTFCRYCKDQGHLLEDCQLRIASNRRRENDQGNYTGPSTSGAQRGAEKISHSSAPQVK